MSLLTPTRHYHHEQFENHNSSHKFFIKDVNVLRNKYLMYKSYPSYIALAVSYREFSHRYKYLRDGWFEKAQSGLQCPPHLLLFWMEVTPTPFYGSILLFAGRLNLEEPINQILMLFSVCKDDGLPFPFSILWVSYMSLCTFLFQIVTCVYQRQKRDLQKPLFSYSLADVPLENNFTE